MKNGIVVILLDIGLNLDRTFLERIENDTFDSMKDLENFLTINNKLSLSEFQLLRLTDFMDYANNEEISLENYWVGYVNIIE